MGAAIQIGKTSAGRRFALPFDLATETVGVWGRRGTGKSHTAVVMTEELIDAGGQVVIIDPQDIWWGLGSSKDGKRSGYEIPVLGGSRANVPLNPEDGDAVAEYVGSNPASCVVSLRDFESQASIRRFVTDFANKLHAVKGRSANRWPLTLILEEAHLLAPSKLHSDGGAARMVGALQRLVRQGRSSGVGVWMIDQRPNSVNADLRTQVSAMVCHSLSNKLDVDAVSDWVELNDSEGRSKEFRSSLARLGRGEAWVWSPVIDDGVFERVSIRDRRTFDSSATPKLGAGKSGSVADPKARAIIDIDALSKAMAKAVEDAKARDPKLLAARIKQLEAELAKAQKAPDVSAAVASAIAPYAEAIGAARDRLREAEVAAIDIQDVIAEAVRDSATAVRQAVNAAAIELNGKLEKSAAKSVAAVPVPIASVTPPVIRSRGEQSGTSGDLTTYQRDLLAVFLSRAHVSTSRSQAARSAGVSHKSSTFFAAIRELVSRGLLSKDGKSAFRPTEAAIAASDVAPVPTHGPEAVAYWRSRLEEYPRLVLEAVSASASAMTREQIGERIGRSATSSSMIAAIRDLAQLGLVERVGRSGWILTHGLR